MITIRGTVLLYILFFYVVWIAGWIVVCPVSCPILPRLARTAYMYRGTEVNDD